MNKHKRILVTGSSGFIGTNAVTSDIFKDYTVGSISRKSHEREFHYQGELSDKEFVEKTISDFRPNFIVHLSASKNQRLELHEYDQIFQDNLINSWVLFNEGIKAEFVEKIITFGSGDEYGLCEPPFNEKQSGKPANIYGLSKLFVTQLTTLINQNISDKIFVVRPSVVYGPHQSDGMLLPSLIESLLDDKRFPMTDGVQTRDFVYIDDLLMAVKLIMENDVKEERIFNIGSGEKRAVKDVVELVASILNKKDLLGLGEKKMLIKENLDYEFSIDLSKKVLGYKTQTTLKEGLLNMIEHHKSRR